MAQASLVPLVPPQSELPAVVELVGKSGRKISIVTRFEQLPIDVQEKITGCGITPDEANANLQTLFNIIHFKLKKCYYTPEAYSNPNRKNVRRHNRGMSQVDPGIVSTNSLSAERAELLTIDIAGHCYSDPTKIGSGGFGTVYSMYSTLDGARIAVKRMPHSTTKQRRKNYQEVRFLHYLARFKHPNILPYIRAFLHSGELWLTTALVQGATLQKLVQHRGLTEPEIAYICMEMLQGIKLLHENQLAHRDLKSANIIIDYEGNVKIIDFGLCTDISQGSLVHMVGSPFWVPPEMVLREPHALSADIWSFGICVMEMANRAPPHRKSSIRAMFVTATQGYPQPFYSPDAWSEVFQDFTRSCLRRDPADRPTVDILLQHPFLQKKCNRALIKSLINYVQPLEIRATREFES